MTCPKPKDPACYFCSEKIVKNYYWVPLQRQGTYAVCCKECHKKLQEVEQ